MSTPEIRISHGNKYPYDAPDRWWDGDGENPPPPRDWSHTAARGVLADLQDRRGIKWGFEDIDSEVRVEIVDSLAAIIREAARQGGVL